LTIAGKCRGQKDKHWSTKHYTENERFNNTNHTKNHTRHMAETNNAKYTAHKTKKMSNTDLNWQLRYKLITDNINLH
jgi:hypothetical protein